jgi:hypothetical protein
LSEIGNINNYTNIERFFDDIKEEAINSYFDFEKKDNEYILTARYKHLSNLIHSHLYTMCKLAEKNSIALSIEYTKDGKEILRVSA